MKQHRNDQPLLSPAVYAVSRYLVPCPLDAPLDYRRQRDRDTGTRQDQHLFR